MLFTDTTDLSDPSPMVSPVYAYRRVNSGFSPALYAVANHMAGNQYFYPPSILFPLILHHTGAPDCCCRWTAYSASLASCFSG